MLELVFILRETSKRCLRKSITKRWTQLRSEKLSINNLYSLYY
nr:MAG TPA: hypothetical protein [Caudoviricetes sp.]